MKNLLSKNGFTFIELLITISIIAILSAIGLMSYSNVLKNSRDSQRKSDLKYIQSALEDYYADLVYYPSGSLPFGNPFTNCTGTYPVCSSPTRTYITTLPTDPSTSSRYLYSAIPANCDNNSSGTGKCTGYCIYAKLEMSSPSIFTGDNVCAAGAGSYNFGVTRP